MTPKYDHVCYLRNLIPLDEMKKTVSRAVDFLSYYEFDSLAFRGLSGALIAPTVALLMGKTLLAVRKTTDNCHSSRLVEGNKNAERYIILDDCVQSGATARAIMQSVYNFAPRAFCLGALELGDLMSGAWQSGLRIVTPPNGSGAMPGKILKITGGLALATGQNHPPLIHVAIIIPIPVEQSGLVGGMYKLASSATLASN